MAETCHTRFLAFLELQSHDTNEDQLSGKQIWDCFLHGNQDGIGRMTLEEDFLQFVVHQFDEDVSDAATSDEDIVDRVQREANRKVRVKVRSTRSVRDRRIRCGSIPEVISSSKGATNEPESEDNIEVDRSEDMDQDSSDNNLDEDIPVAHQESKIPMSPYMKFCNRIRREKDQLRQVREASLIKFQELMAQFKDLDIPTNIIDGHGILPRPARRIEQEYFCNWLTTNQEAKEFLTFAKRSKRTRRWIKKPKYETFDRRSGDLMYLVIMPFYIHRRVQFMIKAWSPKNLGPVPKEIRTNLAHMAYFRSDLVLNKERRKMWRWYVRVANFVNQTYRWPLENQTQQLMDNASSETNNQHLDSCENPSCSLVTVNNLGRQTWQKPGTDFVADPTNGVPFDFVVDLIKFLMIVMCGYHYSFTAEHVFGFGLWEN